MIVEIPPNLIRPSHKELIRRTAYFKYTDMHITYCQLHGMSIVKGAQFVPEKEFQYHKDITN
jgi:hypothetical protein